MQSRLKLKVPKDVLAMGILFRAHVKRFANMHSTENLYHSPNVSFHSLAILLSLTRSCQVHRTSDGVEITSQSGKATVTYDPLRVELSINGEIAVVFNSRGLFNFEHYRRKP